ncbi:hypothetical protein Sango_0743900 [Sesamum angolense]|uniref:Uncharacterized protein n=1 Tax=Sesamum angolense TaxID=2727404 RepID=A0AAE1X2I7_9LAMI|nr:hypothetical protein Sango_0743900 [Sesamum angolense]
MAGRVSKEIEVMVPASEAWKVHGSLQLARIVGEGSDGTILHVSLPPGTGTAGLPWYKEKYTVVDDERRVKDAEVLEDGLMDLGFTVHRYRMEVIEKEECIVRGSIEYELKEKLLRMLSWFPLSPSLLSCSLLQIT